MLNKAIIDLNAIRENADLVKKDLKSTKLCAVVKADAYGHGAEKVACALYSKCDCFAVALVEEGVALRLSGIDKAILVLVPVLKSDLPRAVYYNLTLTVQSAYEVFLINAECERQDRRVKVHIKFNSGMNRLGVDGLEQLKAVMVAIHCSKRVILDGVFSHLACPEQKKITQSAVDKFLLAIKTVKGYNKDAVCHLSSSGGFINGYHFDMVRIGILLYGYTPFITDKIKPKKAMQVFAPVIKSGKTEKGATFLYGKAVQQKQLDYRLLRFGYADGLERTSVPGQINDRCMDLTAVRSMGEQREFLGADWVCVMDDAERLARAYHTISYEILTKVAIRAERIYLD